MCPRPRTSDPLSTIVGCKRHERQCGDRVGVLLAVPGPRTEAAQGEVTTSIHLGELSEGARKSFPIETPMLGETPARWNVAASEPAGIFPSWPELEPGRSFNIDGRYLVREFDFTYRLRRWLTPTKHQTTQFAWLN